MSNVCGGRGGAWRNSFTSWSKNKNMLLQLIKILLLFRHYAKKCHQVYTEPHTWSFYLTCYSTSQSEQCAEYVKECKHWPLLQLQFQWQWGESEKKKEKTRLQNNYCHICCQADFVGRFSADKFNSIELLMNIYKLLTVGVERCRHAPPSLVMWLVNFMRGLAPPHSASTNSRIAMATQGWSKPNQTTWELKRGWIDSLFFFVLDSSIQSVFKEVNGIIFFRNLLRYSLKHSIGSLNSVDKFKNILKVNCTVLGLIPKWRGQQFRPPPTNYTKIKWSIPHK